LYKREVMFIGKFTCKPEMSRFEVLAHLYGVESEGVLPEERARERVEEVAYQERAGRAAYRLVRDAQVHRQDEDQVGHDRQTWERRKDRRLQEHGGDRCDRQRDCAPHPSLPAPPARARRT